MYKRQYFRYYPNIANGSITLTYTASIPKDNLTNFRAALEHQYRHSTTLRIVDGWDFNPPKKGEVIVQFFLNKRNLPMVKIMICDGNVDNAKVYLSHIVKKVYSLCDEFKIAQVEKKAMQRVLPF